MSTRLYPRKEISETEIKVLVKKQNKNEISWYIDEVINTQLESVKDVLTSCVEHLDETDSTPYKLPLSSHQSEVIKGTITRENFKITELHLIINSKLFNGGKKSQFKLIDSQFIVIRQLLDCHDAIMNALSNIDKIGENKKNGNDIDLFIRYMDMLCSHVNNARKSLMNADPLYQFPSYRVNGTLFEPQLPKNGVLDFLVNNGELSVEFRSLNVVEKKPWSMIIDPAHRLSFADIVRKQIAKKRGTPVNKIIVEEYQKYLDLRKDHPDLDHEDQEEAGFTSTIKHIFTSNNDPSLSTLIKSAYTYLEKSFTYIDDKSRPFVVKVADKCEVVTSDPILLSISIKLESIEKTLLRIRENLTNIY